MPRPRLRRRVCFSPGVTYYKPQGVPLSELKIVSFSLEEMECLRLKNVLGLSQIDSAKKMNTSQSTFQRLICCAQRKLSKAIIEGNAIRIAKE